MSVYVSMSLLEGYECEYKVFQDKGIYDEPGIVWNVPTSLEGKKVVDILFKSKFLVKRVYSGPLETLGNVHHDLVLPLDKIQDEFYVDSISKIFSSNLLNLPQKHHRTMISKLTDTANSLFALPENFDLLRLPLHFSARFITVEQEGEQLDAALARAITPSLEAARMYQTHLSLGRGRLADWPELPPLESLSEYLEKQKEKEKEMEKETERLQRVDDHDHQERSCSICLERILEILSLDDKYGAKHGAIFMPCHHAYHSSCVIHWLNVMFFCPLCDPGDLFS